MGIFFKIIIGLAPLFTIGACVDHASSRNPVTMTTADQGTRDEIYGYAVKYRTSEMSTDRFMVFWTIDYGYRLNPENDLDTVIIPGFEDKSALQEFNKFFSNENLALNVGKKIYCDCVGERFEKDGVISYKIREAYLFAR